MSKNKYAVMYLTICTFFMLFTHTAVKVSASETYSQDQILSLLQDHYAEEEVWPMDDENGRYVFDVRGFGYGDTGHTFRKYIVKVDPNTYEVEESSNILDEVNYYSLREIDQNMAGNTADEISTEDNQPEETYSEEMNSEEIQSESIPAEEDFSLMMDSNIWYAASFYCQYEPGDSFTLSAQDPDQFWEVLSYYAAFLYRSGSAEQRSYNGMAYVALPESDIRKASFALFKDFKGAFPENGFGTFYDEAIGSYCFPFGEFGIDQFRLADFDPGENGTPSVVIEIYNTMYGFDEVTGRLRIEMEANGNTGENENLYSSTISEIKRMSLNEPLSNENMEEADDDDMSGFIEVDPDYSEVDPDYSEVDSGYSEVNSDSLELDSISSEVNPGFSDADIDYSLYDAIVKAYMSSFRPGLDNDYYMANDISIILRNTQAADEVTAAMMDLDGNGVKELLLGFYTYRTGEEAVLLDLYTIENGRTVHILSSMDRERYYLCDGDRLMEIGSGGAGHLSYNFYRLKGSELVLLEKVFQDSSQNPSSPWFHQDGDKLQNGDANISENEAYGIIDSYTIVDRVPGSLAGEFELYRATLSGSAPIGIYYLQNPNGEQICFEAYLADCTWDEAMKNAVGKEGRLAIIESGEELSSLMDALSRKQWEDGTTLLVGAARDENSTSYEWKDENGSLIGMPLNDERSFAYTKWGPGQPSLYSGDTEETVIALVNYGGIWAFDDIATDTYRSEPELRGKLGYLVTYDPGKYSSVYN